MAEDSSKSSDGFEPPKYLTSLIAAVNDGAKAAQGGALLFALVDVYLLATAFSATDEDLLRGRTVTITQIGATLPVSFSFAIAPFVFVFLHIYTLARYDMLAVNVRQFLGELQRPVLLETDRERCRQLLANVEFIQAFVAPRGSRQYSPLWRWLVWGVVAIFPVFVLLLVQINALRYQSQLITWLQRLGLMIDLWALVWFFRRNPLDGSEYQHRSYPVELRRWAKLLWLPAIVVGLNLVYMNVVPEDADVRLVRYYYGRPGANQDYLTDLLRQPLDVGLCPSLNWGCRYLRVAHRTLVDHVWDDKTMADLRRGGDVDQANLAAIEGLELSGRSLRFAVLDESWLIAVDLINADLRGAQLLGAVLPRARLIQANLSGTDLRGARLEHAGLAYAQLQGAHPDFAQLQGASLAEAQLQGVVLDGAQLQGVDLNSAQLQGASLTGANLQSANLRGAQLLGADLKLARLQGADAGAYRFWLPSSPTQLQGADLRGAQLQGAVLAKAWLQGVVLDSAQLQGVDLRGARLWRASLAGTDLGLSDLLEADFTTRLTDDQIKVLRAALDARLVATLKRIAEKWQDASFEAVVTADAEKLAQLLSADQTTDTHRFTASSERQVLVSDPKNPFFADVPEDWLITSPTPEYTSALHALLAVELASDPAIAVGIVSRVLTITPDTEDWRRSLYMAVACGLLANGETEKAKVDQRSMDRLSFAMRDKCEPAKHAAPH
jgi:uncharacterized protein YjbI with pentapeptide repeats